jgi:gliding motility-associated-like protein
LTLFSHTINITVNHIVLDSLTVWKNGDICEGESTDLFANYNGAFGTYSFQWSNGLGSGTGPISVSPTQSSIYQVTVTDQCQNSVTNFVVVNVLQAPVVNIPEIVGQGCGPLTIVFEDQVADSGTFSYAWTFGDGTSSNLPNPTHTYTTPGKYPITVIKTGANGCPGQQSGQSFVVVNPTPIADGIPDKYVTDITSPTFVFTDQSIGATAIRWDFSPVDFSIDAVASYTYPDTGIYPVHLKAANGYGCESVHDFVVEVINPNKITVPTAFIPNSNGGNGGTYDATSLSNEVFYARLESVTSFQMYVFNRWGELIFESNDVNIGWDGYYRGELSAQDVYVWKIDVVFNDGSQISDVGNLTLIQ